MANYEIQEGTLLETFETIGDWTAGGTAGGSIAVDSSIYKVGTGSLKVTSVNGNYYATKTINVDLSRAGIIQIDVYFEDISKATNAVLYLSSSASLTSYFFVTLNDLHNGWNRYTIRKNLWSNTGSEDWANTMIRMRVRLDATDTTSAYFDNLRYGVWNRPKVIFNADDGWATQYSELYAYTKTRYPEFKATYYVFASAIGTAGYMTLAELTELYNAGWDISNHTYNHTNLTTLSTEEEMKSQEITPNENYLITNGFTRNDMHKHFAYPNGGHNDTTRLATAALSMKTSRTVLSSGSWVGNSAGFSNDVLKIRNLGNTTTIAAIKADVDYAIASGTTLIINSHKFVTPATTTTEFPVADMQALVDYIMKYHYGGVLDVMPMSLWYKGLTNARKPV